MTKPIKEDDEHEDQKLGDAIDKTNDRLDTSHFPGETPRKSPGKSPERDQDKKGKQPS